MKWFKPKPIPEPDCFIEVNFGGVTFTGSGSAQHVFAAYHLFIQQMQIAYESKTEDHTQALPAFRSAKLGSC